MKQGFLNLVSAMIIAFCLVKSATGDIRYKVKVTRGGHTTESTTLITGQRKLTESGTTMLIQCDLKRTLMISDKIKKYFVLPLSKEDARRIPSNTQSTITPAPIRSGGTVIEALTTTDTGERKLILGHTARHLKITYFQESSADACDQRKVHYEEDGWYIELDAELKCSPDRPSPPTPSSCRDKIEIKRVGSATKIFPLIKTITDYNAAGDPISTTTAEVIELSTDPLDPALLDIPPGYTEAKTPMELIQIAPTPLRPGIRQKP